VPRLKTEVFQSLAAELRLSVFHELTGRCATIAYQVRMQPGG